MAQSTEFLESLEKLSPTEWAAAGSRARQALGNLLEWDDAWETAGLATDSQEAFTAVETARRAGGGATVVAAAAAAVAALIARPRLTDQQFRVLYGPFQELIPA